MIFLIIKNGHCMFCRSLTRGIQFYYFLTDQIYFHLKVVGGCISNDKKGSMDLSNECCSTFFFFHSSKLILSILAFPVQVENLINSKLDCEKNY